MKRYKLLALDLDGTLLNSSEEISDTNLLSLSSARQEGVKVIITTGRSTPSAIKFIQKVNIPDPSITYNGAVIHNGGKVLRALTLEADVVYETIRLLKKMHFTPILYGANDQRYFEDIMKHRDGFYWLSQGFEKKNVKVENLLENRREDIVRISLFIDESDIPVLEAGLGKVFNDTFRTTQTFFPDLNFWIYEILDTSSSKSKGLHYLCKLYGIHREEVIAVGDNRNDLDMLRWAGLGVAMKNGLPDIFEYADYITEKDNNEDGVAEVIQKFIKN